MQHPHFTTPNKAEHVYMNLNHHQASNIRRRRLISRNAMTNQLRHPSSLNTHADINKRRKQLRQKAQYYADDERTGTGVEICRLRTDRDETVENADAN